MLQKELDAITATLQQLENQKEQAQKCLDELDEKVLPSHLYPWGEANIQLSPREINQLLQYLGDNPPINQSTQSPGGNPPNIISFPWKSTNHLSPLWSFFMF